MKTTRAIYVIFAFLAILAGCAKDETDGEFVEQLSVTGSKLKSLNAEVDFGALGTVRLVGTTFVKGEDSSPVSTTFTYRITPGTLPVSGLDLLVSLCSADPLIQSCTNATAAYGADRFLRSAAAYKTAKWLMVSNVADFSGEITFKLKGLWVAEPRTAILKGTSSYAVNELPLPVCQTGAGLAIVETLSAEASGNGLMVTGKILDPGFPPFYSCGIIWNQTGVPFYPANVENMATSAGVSADNTFTTLLTEGNNGSTYYIRAYALNSWFPYIHDLGIGYGNLVAFPAVEVNYGSFTDSNDGYTYKTVELVGLTWMAENLRYLPYVNPVPVRKQPMKDPIYVYGYTGTDAGEAMATENYQNYGALYSYQAALTSCPDGWRLPTDKEWQDLESELGMDANDLILLGFDKIRLSGEVAEKIKTTYGWGWSPNLGNLNSHAVGTNITGFSAQAGGSAYFGTKGTSFSYIGTMGYFWTSTLVSDKAYYRGLTYYDQRVERSTAWLPTGYSVRCVKK